MPTRKSISRNLSMALTGWIAGVLGIVAFGLRFGESRGLFVDVSLRAFNHTFGGYCLSAGYGF